MTVKILNESTLVEQQSASGKVIIDFSASWCGPCKMLAPVFESVSDASEFSDVTFIKVDIDDTPELVAKYGVRGVPTLVVLKDGVEVGRKSGAQTAKALSDFISKSLE